MNNSMDVSKVNSENPNKKNTTQNNNKNDKKNDKKNDGIIR